MHLTSGCGKLDPQNSLLIIKMKMSRLITATIFTLFIINVLPSEAAPGGNGLHVGFYDRRCPNVEKVVADIVAKAHLQDPRLPAGLIRLFSHDCFVKGCDASILLDTTPSGEPVEKQSQANIGGLIGLEVIDEIKAQLEIQCPQTVSCADILAFAAREAVFLAGLPYHKTPAGRRDSRTSRSADVFGNLPFPTTPMDDIIDIFARKGLTLNDLVVLTGAHSIGKAHCNFFDYRLYKFNENQVRDPSLDPFYAHDLSLKCPEQDFLAKDETKKVDNIVDLDPITPLKLDNQYYTNLLQGKGLFQSDQTLASDVRTAGLVHRMAISNDAWGEKFVSAMIKMGRTHVLTDNLGEIRKTCRAFN